MTIVCTDGERLKNTRKAIELKLSPPYLKRKWNFWMSVGTLRADWSHHCDTFKVRVLKVREW